MDQRERFSDDEEALRAAVAGILKHHHFAAVSILAQDSDGKTLVAQPAMKRRDVAQDGTTQFVEHPLLLDVPIHHPGGGGVTHTFAQKAGDEIVSIILSRPSSPWKQNGGVQQPVETRMNSLSDAVALPGFRSDPRQLQQISTTTAQVRDDKKMHVVDHDPAAGITHFSADPSTSPASATFDPFTMASAFLRHIVQGAAGIIGSAVSSGGTHEHGVTHAGGAFMRAMNGMHQVLAQPSGALLSAFSGAHTGHGECVWGTDSLLRRHRPPVPSWGPGASGRWRGKRCPRQRRSLHKRRHAVWRPRRHAARAPGHRPHPRGRQHAPDRHE